MSSFSCFHYLGFWGGGFFWQIFVTCKISPPPLNSSVFFPPHWFHNESHWFEWNCSRQIQHTLLPQTFLLQCFCTLFFSKCSWVLSTFLFFGFPPKCIVGVWCEMEVGCVVKLVSLEDNPLPEEVHGLQGTLVEQEGRTCWVETTVNDVLCNLRVRQRNLKVVSGNR